MASTDAVSTLVDRNKQWVEDVLKFDKDFFKRSAEGQSPQVLWIGCSDSRVPASVITGSKPGTIFAHKNIANQVHLNDDNLMSVLAFAVGVLKVKYVLVVGHSECGGAKFCLSEAQKTPPSPPQIPATPFLRWLKPLTGLARDLKLGPNELPRLVEENVRKQVHNILETDTIKVAQKNGGDVSVHGLIYDLSTGHLNVLPTLPGEGVAYK